MKALSFAIVAIALIAGSQSALARTYQVVNIGEGGLKSACARGGGTFNSGVNDYACTYKNGNIRDCNRSSGHCITVTPKIVVVLDNDIFDTSSHHATMGEGGTDGGTPGGKPGGFGAGTFNPASGSGGMSVGGGKSGGIVQ